VRCDIRYLLLLLRLLLLLLAAQAFACSEAAATSTAPDMCTSALSCISSWPKMFRPSFCMHHPSQHSSALACVLQGMYFELMHTPAEAEALYAKELEKDPCNAIILKRMVRESAAGQGQC
jgi:hypothetical protein